MKPLKVKIIGSGGAAQKHRSAFEALPEMYQITESNDYDIVDICTPNWLHFQQAIAAIHNECHAIVEKPVCGSLFDIDRLADKETERKYRVFPIFQYRFTNYAKWYHPGADRQIITQWKRDASYHDGWRGDWRQAFGGALTSHGIHLIDLAIQHFGMPKIVTAGMDTHLGPERFADVFMGEPGNMIRVATFIHPDIEQGGFVLGDSQTGYTEQFRRIHAAITQGEPAPVTLAEARQSLEVLTAAYWSAYTGEPAMLPIGPDHPFYAGWSEAFAQRSEQQRRPSPISRKIHE